MKYLFGALVFIIGFCCVRNETNSLHGLWKIKRIELLKETKFNRLLDTAVQYWNFRDKGRLEIYNDQEVQNSLRVRVKNKCINSLDSVTGEVTEKFYIEYLDKNTLELASHKKLPDADYCVMYYLDKLDDSDSSK